MKFLRNLIIILLVLLAGAWFALTPAQAINSKNQLVNVQGADISQYMGRALSNAELSSQGATSEVSLSQDEFNAVLKNSLADSSSASVLLNGTYELKNGYILAKLPYQIFGLMTSQIEVQIGVTLTDQTLSLDIRHARLGKLPVLNALVERAIKESLSQTSAATVSGTRISFTLPNSASLLRTVQVQSGQLKLGVAINQDDLFSLGLNALFGGNG